MNKLVNKYVSLIKTNKMTKTEIDYMRKALGMCSTLNAEEKKAIEDAFYSQVEKKGGIKITEDHSTQGLSYLKSLAWTPKGKPRQTKNNPFAFREREALLSFKEFRLVALYDCHNGLGERTHVQPVWRVIGKRASFEYVQGRLWQGIEVIG